jgi:hypothetical protein
MPLTGDTGNGATLTLALFNGTAAITASLDVIDITPGDFTVPPVNVSTLGTTQFEEHIPGDLAAIGESSATYKFLTSANLPTLPSAAGTCAITFPLRAGESTAAVITGTGFLTRVQLPSFANNELQVGEVSWQWDGDIGPTFTRST